MGAIRDIRNQLEPNIALEPQVINSDTTTVGEIIDTADYDGGIVFTQLINWVSGTFTPKIEESDSETFAAGVTEVADESLIGDVKTGQEADSALTSAQLISSIGVVNNIRRYLRYNIVSTGAGQESPNNIIASVCHKHAEVAKISNP